MALCKIFTYISLQPKDGRPQHTKEDPPYPMVSSLIYARVMNSVD